MMGLGYAEAEMGAEEGCHWVYVGGSARMILPQLDKRRACRHVGGRSTLLLYLVQHWTKVCPVLDALDERKLTRRVE